MKIKCLLGMHNFMDEISFPFVRNDDYPIQYEMKEKKVTGEITVKVCRSCEKFSKFKYNDYKNRR